jgi:Domain of unknown function (DUF202)
MDSDKEINDPSERTLQHLANQLVMLLNNALKEKIDSDKEINDPSERTLQHLANRRTFLAWLRTSVALIGLGFIVSRFITY